MFSLSNAGLDSVRPQESRNCFGTSFLHRCWVSTNSLSGLNGGRACCIVSDWTTSAMVMLLTSRCDEAIGDENHLASIMVLIIKLGSESESHASLIQSEKVASGYSWWWRES